METQMIKALLIIYGICLIPTIIATIAWPEAHKEVLQNRLGPKMFFLSAWLASPFILLWMLINKISGK